MSRHRLALLLSLSLLALLLLLVAGLKGLAMPNEALPPKLSPSPVDVSLSPETPAPSDRAGIMSEYRAIAKGESRFFSVTARRQLSIEELAVAVSEEAGTVANAHSFSIADLDRDSMPELILRLMVNADRDYGYEVLHYNDGLVYGYTVWYRALTNLKTDGSFQSLSSEHSTGYGYMSFGEKDFKFVSICGYSAGGLDGQPEYYVDGESAELANYLLAIEQQEKKKDATWYELTEENIDSEIV